MQFAGIKDKLTKMIFPCTGRLEAAVDINRKVTREALQAMRSTSSNAIVTALTGSPAHESRFKAHSVR